ncbi:transcription factor IIH subunit 4 [Seminavis robusta]|uniref:General transcription factor IIH subunit 4 n=1 Tax=Seminavis robusta TaxID=568900 RepID=A0A9N8H511_9STRA|nr:transcription factor IIH subunit 4 [Seminavis robusta]|eukprot:Sro63_g035770.1 transcription factor IIH subunit 4 (538) ;mRNA; r:57178-58986
MGKKSKKTTTKGVMDFLQNALSKTALLQLYTEETRGRFICRAVLQKLTPVAQQVVVRLSSCGGSFPASSVEVWIANSGTTVSGTNNKTRFQQIMTELQRWAILAVPGEGEGNNANTVTLAPDFAKGLQETLLSPDSSPWKKVTREQVRAMEQEAKEKPRDVSFEDLERYTQSQFDAILHFLVGTPKMKIQPPPAVIHFLLQTGLMQPDPEYKGSNSDDAPLVITERGYDFMLQDNAQQVWHFVVQYLRSLESAAAKKHKNLAREALLLLVCLGFAQLGEGYLGSSLSKDSRVMVKDLALFGLLFVRKIGKQTIFYPTRVAMELVGHDDSSSGGNAASSMWSLSSKALNAALTNPRPQNSSHLAIVVQTNFQLCAYTTSELHVSMLGLFCDVQTIRRLPNVVFMTITRDSVKAAFCLGIKARQILRFMEKHAHPKVREAMMLPGTSLSMSDSPVPANVVDQIWLWDRERHRVQWTEVYSHQCLMQGEFQAVYQYTKEQKAHAWSSEARKSLLINYAHAEKVQSFVRAWRAKAASRQED